MITRSFYSESKPPGIVRMTFNILFYLFQVILNSTDLTEEFNRNWDRMAPFALGYKEPNFLEMKATNEIREFYFEDEEISVDTRDNLTNMFSDRNFFQCTRKASLAYARFSPVYLYYFTQEGLLSWLDVFKIPKELGNFNSSAC